MRVSLKSVEEWEKLVGHLYGDVEDLQRKSWYLTSKVAVVLLFLVNTSVDINTDLLAQYFREGGEELDFCYPEDGLGCALDEFLAGAAKPPVEDDIPPLVSLGDLPIGAHYRIGLAPVCTTWAVVGFIEEQAHVVRVISPTSKVVDTKEQEQIQGQSFLSLIPLDKTVYWVA